MDYASVIDDGADGLRTLGRVPQHVPLGALREEENR